MGLFGKNTLQLPLQSIRLGYMQEKTRLVLELRESSDQSWFGKEECCSLCNAPNASLQHILSGCKTALSQVHYRWRHDQVLRKLAEVLEGRRQGSRESPPAEDHISSVTEGGGRRNTRPRETARPFSPNQEWNMRVDLNRQLQFPTEITTTSLRPDIVVWSKKAKSVHLIKLMLPLEEGIEAAFERKWAKYEELAAAGSDRETSLSLLRHQEMFQD
ncbi:hypothetical protein ABVT39_010967 [Epinephelus coioides]